MTEPSIEVRKHEISRAAKRIDPQTALMVWWYAQTCDPYDLGYDLPDEARQVGREYFLVDPIDECPVLVDDVRDLHPDVPDDEWDRLMAAAAERDTSGDPFPVFHRYGG